MPPKGFRAFRAQPCMPKHAPSAGTGRQNQGARPPSLKRATAAPDIPTVEESGVNGFAFVSWYGLWGPKNLPADLSNTLQADIAKVLALPDVKQRLNALGFDPIGSGGEQFATYIRDEMAKYEKIIKDAKIKVE
jgi:tripartite-type tricarboxylate transporter receptor subunit TctC